MSKSAQTLGATKRPRRPLNCNCQSKAANIRSFCNFGKHKNVQGLLLATGLADDYELPSDPRLRLVPPLISRRAFGGRVTVDGNRTETQVAVESVGSAPPCAKS